MFIRNAWYIAAWADELQEKPLARRICNDPIVLFRDPGGQPAALVDRCCHRSAPLSLGEVVAEGIQCGYHGLTFDGSGRSEEHTSELQSRLHLVCRLLLEKKKKK